MPLMTTKEVSLRILCFAQLKDKLGAAEFRVTLPEGSCGRDLFAHLLEKNPSLKPLLEVSRLAVNCEYASFNQVLRDGDEVAMIPPVSGG